MTNGDFVRNMTNKELANFLMFDICDIMRNKYYLVDYCKRYPNCKNCIIEWLNSETNIDKKPDFTNHTGNALDYPN